MISLASILGELKRSIEGDVRFDKGTLTVYSTDASNYRQIPIGVIAPRHDGDVATALRVARETHCRFSHAEAEPASPARQPTRRWCSTFQNS